MKKRSWFKNFLFCLHDVWLYKKTSIVMLVVSIVSSLSLAILGALTSYFVVLSLSNGSGPERYLLIIGLLSLATFLFTALQIWGSNTYNWDSTFTRCTVSWQRLTEKAIVTDYLNIEPRDKQKVFSKGFRALDSNWVGLEMEMKQAPQMFLGFFGMLIYATISAIFVPWILLVMIPMIFFSGLWAYLGFRYMKKTADASDTKYQRLYLLNTDCTTLENAKDIRAYRLDKWFYSVYDVMNKELFHIERKSKSYLFFGEASNTVFLFLRDLVAYLILAQEYLQGTIDLSTFAFLIGIVAGFSTWVNDFVTSYDKARTNSFYIDNYREAIEVKDSLNHSKGIDIKSLQKPFKITLDHVSFTYPGDSTEILHDVCLDIVPGEKIALVGNNGAGKTTLIKLLCGLYKPTKGVIRLNDIDISEFNIDDYMSLISALFQDVRPLALTVKNNVTCATRGSVDEDRYQEAIEEAGIQEKINSLPQKDDTYITQVFDLSGIQLSGGETQRLLLARALYKNAPLLILDEPTAALDPLAEEEMYKKYLSFSKGNTSIFISHRLASTRFCDRIVYLDNGTIEEVGSHDELLKKSGKYKEMFTLQAKYYQEEETHAQ